MQSQLPEALLATAQGRRAEEILRACVHCGICNAVCPTYGLLGDELDGPRGRIYLIKELLETPSPARAAAKTAQVHLDRCLSCRGCEVACPSGVAYGELLEIGRAAVEERRRRRGWDGLLRRWLGRILPQVRDFARWMALGRAFRWLLPRRFAKLIRIGRPPPKASPALPLAQAARMAAAQRARRGDGSAVGTSEADGLRKGRILLLQGCVQRSATPQTCAAAVRLCMGHGIATLSAPEEVCCGALNLHLGQTHAARDLMRRNVAALRPFLSEVDCIVSTASGCGATVKDYGRLLADDAECAADAKAVAALTKDLTEIAGRFRVAPAISPCERPKVAWHPPCTLQHGQGLSGTAERLLAEAGYQLVEVADAHLCCGSAGTYSLLQPRLANALRKDKLAKLTANGPDLIATANIGCQMHLAAEAPVPVAHWAELLRCASGEDQERLPRRRHAEQRRRSG